MLDSFFIILLVVAILLILLSVEWESMAFCVLDIILWLVLAVSVHQIEIPYEAIDGNNNIVTGTHNIESMFPLSILFYGIAIIMFIYFLVNLALPFLSGKIRDRGML